MTGTGEGPGLLPLCTALLCAAAALWAVVGRQRELRRAHLLFAGGGTLTPGETGPRGCVVEAFAALRRHWRARYGGRIGREVLCLPAGGVLAVLGESVMPLVGAAVAMPLVGRWLRVRRRRQERERRVGDVIDLCGAVAGELRAGRQPGEALMAVPVEDLGDGWPLVSAAARFGGDVPGALRSAAATPGAEGLTGVAACWQVAVDGGAGLATGLDRVGAALRAERDQREQLRAQLASQRATALVLAILPVFVLLIGTVMGAAPLRVLFHTPIGVACLVVGGLLEWAGLVWTARLVRAAAERGAVERGS
ncbi:type II secretion system F family protein [Streptomyces sp. NPDC018031]|uniref:type II secretion system F family protein n=1 Tax=Streptomyces sp. NPDC018031 TaxID=3365033 RepID=UPI003799716B